MSAATPPLVVAVNQIRCVRGRLTVLLLQEHGYHILRSELTDAASRPMRTLEIFQMPMLIIHAAIACVTQFAPRRAAVSIQRFLTNIAVARADARWLATAVSAQYE